MAVVARFHPDLELTSLLLRSGLHQNRALFSSAAPLMSQKLASQQQRALQKQPRKIHAPQVFIKDVFDSVQLSSNIELDTSQAQELLHRAVAHFKGLQWHEKEHYRRRAELLQQQQLEDMHSRADDFQLQIMAALQEEAQEAQQLQGLCRLSNCKLSDVDIETMSMRAADKQNSSLVETFLLHLLQSPYPPPQQHQSDLQQHQLYDRAPLRPYGEATALVCRNRKFFLDVVLSWQDEVAEVWWYVLYASLKPVSLRAVKLERLEFVTTARMQSPQTLRQCWLCVCILPPLRA